MALLMNLPGITGEGTVQEHIGWLALAGFTWGGTRVSRANAAGSHRGATRVWAPQLRSATARRKSDSQSALVWLGMVSGTEYPLVKFEWLRTGQGTPGYGFAVENAPKDGKYPRGTVAMARTSDPKTGNGGQFFLVYGDTTLPDPDGYTVFGTVTKGLDIVDKVAAVGVAPNDTSENDGPPAAPISILRVAVTEKKA